METIKFKIKETTATTLRSDLKCHNNYVLLGRVIRENTEWRNIGRKLVEVIEIVSSDLKGNQQLAESQIGKQYWVANNEVIIDIHDLKKELGLKDKDIADFFELTPAAYANSSAKKRYEDALCAFYVFLRAGKKNNKITPTEPD